MNPNRRRLTQRGFSGYFTFGATVNLADYQKVAVPASVQAFLSSDTAPVPSGSEVDQWESIMKSYLLAIPAFVEATKKTFDPKTTWLSKNVMQAMTDCARYGDYLGKKANRWFYSMTVAQRIPYSGQDWLKQVGLPNGINDIVALQMAMKDWVGLELKQHDFVYSTVNGAFALPAQNALSEFYLNKVIPIADRVSQDDALFLYQVFVENQFGQTTLVDLVRALKIVAPFLKKIDFATVMTFAPYMVFGIPPVPDWQVSIMKQPPPVVIAGVTVKPNPVEDLEAELAELRKRYASRVASLGPYLDPATAGYWDTAYAAFTKSQFDPSINTVTANMLQAVLKGVEDAKALAVDTGETASVEMKAVRGDLLEATKTVSNLMNLPLPEEAMEEAKLMAQNVSNILKASEQAAKGGTFVVPESTEAKNSLKPYILYAIAGYLIFTGFKRAKG